MSAGAGEPVPAAAPSAPAPPAGDAEARPDRAPAVDFATFVRTDETGRHALGLMVEGVHCGGCVRRIESAFAGVPGVHRARLNLTTRRLALEWDGPVERAGELAGRVVALGYEVAPYDPARLAGEDRRIEKELLRAMAVAGFAAGNVMLLSISIWAGNAQDMDAATRGLLHWFSALIALPAIAYAGRPFFRSAFEALKAGRMNMDVPISLAVLLAAGMSLFQVIRGEVDAYFDSAVTLLFLLLLGRYLDRRARGRARSQAERLLTLGSSPVTVLDDDGTRRAVPAEQVATGATVFVPAGGRIAVDGRVVAGASEVDASLVTGESVPQRVAVGDRVFAGTVNLAQPLTLEATAVGPDTLLAEIVRLMEVAEQKRARFVSLADRVARLYAPAVHALAAATFVGWFALLGAPWEAALLNAVAVLIITCPCALGLAVPAVQVIASGRLMRRGVLLKSATALERLAEVDTVVFDKTGTLTEGLLRLADRDAIDDGTLRAAAGLAAASDHPLARALVHAAPVAAVAEGVEEVPGRGLRLPTPEGEVRLGSREWCGVDEDAAGERGAASGPELWFTRPGAAPVRFAFDDRLRPDAGEVVAALAGRGYRVALLSGDRRETVAAVARRLGIAEWRGGVTPAEKCAHLEELAAAGRRVLMVGDGLNDAPALAAAHVSLSPSTAVEISQNAADAVFQGRRLAPVLETLSVAVRAERLVRQNFGLSFLYNAIAVPVAVAGLVTPLIAAICMSASSLAVTGNALRLGRGRAA